MARSRYYQFALSSTRAAHLGSPGSPGRCTSNIALIPIGGIQQWALDISASAIGARMQQPHLTATAVEKLKRSAIGRIPARWNNVLVCCAGCFHRHLFHRDVFSEIVRIALEIIERA